MSARIQRVHVTVSAPGVVVELVKTGLPAFGLDWQQARELFADLGRALEKAPKEEVKA
jgi:hypothetical protein